MIMITHHHSTFSHASGLHFPPLLHLACELQPSALHQVDVALAFASFQQPVTPLVSPISFFGCFHTFSSAHLGLNADEAGVVEPHAAVGGSWHLAQTTCVFMDQAVM